MHVYREVWKVVAAVAIAAVATAAEGGKVLITNAADSGPGSLRQALFDANSGACSAPCEIAYGSTGFLKVAPLAPLPPLTATGARIQADIPYQAWSLEISGANVATGSGLRLQCRNCGVSGIIVNGFPGNGIVVEAGANVMLSYNILGLDATGTHAIPNGANGIGIVDSRGVDLSSNTIGGNKANGVYAKSSGMLSFGLDVIGKQYLPQGSGNVELGNGASGIFLQDVDSARIMGEKIAHNALAGVAVAGNSPHVTVTEPGLPTVIWDNGLLPVDFGFDGVTDAGRPVLTRADVSNGFLRVEGEVRSAANTPVSIAVFASDRRGPLGIADAETFLATIKVTTDASGFAKWEVRVAPQFAITGQWISALATADSSSELSAPLQAVANNQNYSVTSTADSGPGSLRQAILDVNAGICASDFPCRIQFDFGSSGTTTIAPLTPLPAITRSGIVIDGSNAPYDYYAPPLPARVEINGSRCAPGAGLTISPVADPVANIGIQRLAINGFNGPGILIDATKNEILNPVITEDLIGTDPSGTVAVPNAGDGILLRGDVPFVHNGTYGSGNQIARNVISGNGGNGVKIEAGFLELADNRIGTGMSKTTPIPNGGAGVRVELTGAAHLEGNTIAFNRAAGLSVASNNAGEFKATLGDAIHSNVGPAIEQTPVVEPAPELDSAIYDPAKQTLTIKGSYTRPPATKSWWTTLTFFAADHPETDGRGSGQTPLYGQVQTQDTGQEHPSFTAMVERVDVRGKRIAATVTPFLYNGWKGAPVDYIFGQGFDYATTSPMSKAVPVVTIGCPADVAVPSAPIGNAVSGAIEFRWSTAAGATGYNVWLRSVPGVPHVIATAIGGSATASLQPGTYEWFVEALFPGCASTKSETAALSVKRGRGRAADH